MLLRKNSNSNGHTVPETEPLKSKNNGKAMTLVLRMIDHLARVNQSAASVETLHDDGCRIMESTEDEHSAKGDPVKLDPNSEETLRHLCACTCDAEIRATFYKERDRDNTLMISSSLSGLKKRLPWLEDEQVILAMLKIGSQNNETLAILGALAFSAFDGPMGHLFTQISLGHQMCGSHHHLLQLGKKH